MRNSMRIDSSEDVFQDAKAVFGKDDGNKRHILKAYERALFISLPIYFRGSFG